MISMEIHQLRYFVAVAEEGHFSRAAEKVHVAQPSLSQQIQKLEAEVGQPLFDRLPRAVLLTEAGKRFREFAQQILANVADAQRCIDEFKGQAVGKLVIGAIPTIAPYLLPRLLPRFQQEHPKVALEVVEDVTENLARSLADGEVDLALLSTCESRDFHRQPLGEEALLVAVPEGHRLAKKERVAWRDLKPERFLGLHRAHCLSRQVEELCSAHGLHPELAVRGAQLSTVVGMVAAGLGLSLVPQMMVDGASNKGCRFLPFVAPVPTRQLNIMRHPLRFQSKAALAFTGTAISCFGPPGDAPSRSVEAPGPANKGEYNPPFTRLGRRPTGTGWSGLVNATGSSSH
jgi:LysR family hydrogen peroxide-inducible transcriptional activator